MATGLNIRDFTKVYRELRYANEGALRLSEVEHNAYLNRLTIEVTHIDANRAINFKTNPENTHWGYCTFLKGSSVSSSHPIKFVKQRVFEGINQGIWNYHQQTESLNLSAAANESGINALIQGGVLGDATDALVRLFIEAKDTLGDSLSNAAAWLIGSRPLGGDDGSEPGSSYTAFPIASPFPDVFKFKSDIPVSFLFRLESWYLVNPAVYITSNPSDTSDETEGEDEYPQPQPGDGDGGSQEFPESSPNDPENDPRDGGQKPLPPIEEGVLYQWLGVLSGTALNASAQPENVSYEFVFQSQGSAFPFDARTSSNVLIVFGGESWYGGVEILGDSGQVVATVFQNTGWRSGTVSVIVKSVIAM